MVPFFIGLGLLIPGIWAKLGMGAGAMAALSCMSAGLFPMNRRLPHNVAAATYFRRGLVKVLLFTVAIWLQNNGRVPRSLEAGGVVTAASYACFLFTGTKRPERDRAESGNPVQTADMEERPLLQAAPAAEWGVFLFTIG
jgi:Ca2+/Na+ antiporter